MGRINKNNVKYLYFINNTLNILEDSVINFGIKISITVYLYFLERILRNYTCLLRLRYQNTTNWMA